MEKSKFLGEGGAMKLADRKTKLVFTTSATVEYREQQRPIVVEPDAGGITLRLLDCSTRYSIPWRLVYNLAKRETARLKSLSKKKAQTDQLDARRQALQQELDEIDTALD